MKRYQVAFSAKVRFLTHVEAPSAKEAKNKIYEVELDNCKIVSAEDLPNPYIKVVEHFEKVEMPPWLKEELV